MSEKDHEEKSAETLVRNWSELLTPENLERMKEATDESKKLIQSLRGKPWPMKKKLVSLR